ncbi:MAG TPA: hypothetical protein VFF31_03445 [Blastocatellia bacterium]|nr:hypothetical protein [Blastocatellia bacterium]
MLAAVLTTLRLLRRFQLRPTAVSVAMLVMAAGFGCGRPFNVKTSPALPPVSYAAKASLDELMIEAHPVIDEDFLYDTFDANLIAAGLLPVRVRLTNNGSEPIELKKARFQIEIPSKRFKSADARRAFKRLFTYYGVSVYSKSGYNDSLEAFTSHVLDVGTALSSNQSRQGLLFFEVPAEAARETGLTLVIDKLKSKSDARAVLKLN